MDIPSRSRDLYKQGRFKESRELLGDLNVSRLDIPTALLKASVSEMTGDLVTAEASASQVLRSRVVSDAQRAAAEFTLARVAATRAKLKKNSVTFRNRTLLPNVLATQTS